MMLFITDCRLMNGLEGQSKVWGDGILGVFVDQVRCVCVSAMAQVSVLEIFKCGAHEN